MVARKRFDLAAQKLDARPDTLDFRDKMYVPTLVEVPMSISLDEYRANGVPILDQGQEGACTGFGLATVANFLLRRRKVIPDNTPVSPRMFYETARRYDEWPGEAYEGSSARGAMKGWLKHGVCASDIWPYDPKHPDALLTHERASDATKRPLGAYFRVNHADLVAMHSALVEAGILYVTAAVHEGWGAIGPDGVIPLSEKISGGHAFAIVAYNQTGFWLQNSWGDAWGKSGFALLTYEDWLANGTDVWVARLGVPVKLEQPAKASNGTRALGSQLAPHDLRPHVISLGNDGQLEKGGTYGNTESDIAAIFTTDFARITKEWKTKRILLYAHGGLVAEKNALERLVDYLPILLEAEVYPISFIWHSDMWSTLKSILKDAVSSRRPEGILDDTKDFMLDRLDDLLEPVARTLTGKAQWDEMKENAQLATVDQKGGARLALSHLAALLKKEPDIEVHIVGHSAGSIFHAPLVQLMSTSGKIAEGRLKGNKGYGIPVTSCTLWAPACTTKLFKQFYVPAIKSGHIKHLALFTLTDSAEQKDNCASIYNKSLLYLVSNAFEEKFRIPLIQPDGEPILGMEKFINEDKALLTLLKSSKADWILAPNEKADGTMGASTSRHHGDFDDDGPTVKATFGRIIGAKQPDAQFNFKPSASKLRERRKKLV